MDLRPQQHLDEPEDLDDEDCATESDRSDHFIASAMHGFQRGIGNSPSNRSNNPLLRLNDRKKSYETI